MSYVPLIVVADMTFWVQEGDIAWQFQFELCIKIAQENNPFETVSQLVTTSFKMCSLDVV